ncbi:hypothetical protein LAJ57_13300, partial [Streptococcus pneumoniae]|uniref:hypothetical protein n=1 Tax=Streptococcus pneumoniae TaxID=1313 RepID=UPI001CBECBD9
FEASQLATEERLGTLQKMLSGFIDERRQGSAETSEALITLQEAMQVMLDRVDAIETKVVAIPVTPQAQVPTPAEQPRAAAASRV